MNYKILFILAFAILAIGGIGIAILSGGDKEEELPPPPVVQQEEPKVVVPEIKNVFINIVTLKNPIEKGSVLKNSDFKVEELEVKENDPKVELDSTELLQKNNYSLQGFLAGRDLSAGAILNINEDLVSPSDPQYFTKAVDLTKDIPYRVTIDGSESYLLGGAITRGSYVQLYTNTQIGRGGRSELVPVSKPLQVLDIKSFIAPEKNTNIFASSPVAQAQVGTAAGYLLLKLSIKDMGKLARLDSVNNKLVPVPVDPELKAAYNFNSRGALINQLQGQ